MQGHFKVLAGKTETVTTKKGTKLEKTRLKLLDLGEEVSGDIVFYWVDFLGEFALSENDLGQIQHQEVVVDVRRVMATAGKDGKAYLNMSGGMILFEGNQVQVVNTKR